MGPFVLHCGYCGAVMTACKCQAPAPTMPPPAPKTTVARFRKHGFYSVCEICGLALDYCKGHALPEMAVGDGDSSDLNKRIREAQAARK